MTLAFPIDEDGELFMLREQDELVGRVIIAINPLRKFNIADRVLKSPELVKIDLVGWQPRETVKIKLILLPSI